MVSVRAEGRVYGTTVTSFASVSADPPLVVISLGPGAQVLPFLDEGRRFVVNVLSADQGRVATVFADPYPVGPSPFAREGDPVLPGTQASLVCSVERVVPVGRGARLVLGLVEEALVGGREQPPLLHYQRGYRVAP